MLAGWDRFLISSAYCSVCNTNEIKKWKKKEKKKKKLKTALFRDSTILFVIGVKEHKQKCTWWCDMIRHMQHVCNSKEKYHKKLNYQLINYTLLTKSECVYTFHPIIDIWCNDCSHRLSTPFNGAWWCESFKKKTQILVHWKFNSFYNCFFLYTRKKATVLSVYHFNRLWIGI